MKLSFGETVFISFFPLVLLQPCGARVDTVKRVRVHTLPRHLIVHLKRFEFDLESGRKYKVNDYCAFPDTLDMQPYMVEVKRAHCVWLK